MLAERRYGQRVDRAGGCRFVEVYPAAALKLWGFQSTGYKGSMNRSKRSALVEELMGATTWLIWNDAAQHCEASDDALDALVASLVARAAEVDRVEVVPDEQMTLAKQEGWIVLPDEGSLNVLAVARSREPNDAQSDRGSTT